MVDAKHLAAMQAAINKSYKGASVRTLADGAASASRDVIPTGIDVLDNYLFGIGGIPGNKVGEVFGGFDSGKTSAAYIFLAAGQRAGGLGILMETENTIIPERAAIFGCNLDDVILAEPECADDVVGQLKILIEMIPDGVGPNVIVWDSLASAPSKAATLGKGDIGSTARLMSKQLPIITKMLAKKRAAVVVINQIRYKVGIIFGTPITTPGGETLKFMSSWRLKLGVRALKKSGSVVTGQDVEFKMPKNKSAFPHRSAIIRLDYGTGWDNIWSTVNFAKDKNVLADGTKTSQKAYDTAIVGLATEDYWWAPSKEPLQEVKEVKEPPKKRGRKKKAE